ncbi:hypothetical protein [Streptomyces sp. NPDC093089]|uniref:hypothetical protein n=1 Tax=Streptomyces sp. NPDC093089 TaxID=3366024 RepID=UPI0037F51557
MPAPPTAVGQTSATPSSSALGAPRGRRRAPAPAPTVAVVVAESEPGPAAGAGGGARGPADDVVRWAAFCCVLVPVVLVVYGTSLGGAAGAALGLVSVTAACRVLLRRSERGLRTEGGRCGRRDQA